MLLVILTSASLWVNFNCFIFLLIMSAIYMVLVFCLFHFGFCMLGKFLLAATTVNFTLLGAEYFCIPRNIFDHCSAIQLIICKQHNPFRSVLRFVRWYQNCIEFKATPCPPLRQDSSENSSQCPVNYEVFPVLLIRTGSVLHIILKEDPLRIC